MDEGWTRWLFEQWGFPFTQVYDAEIQKGNLNAKYDVFIFADDSTGDDHRRARGRAGRGARRHGLRQRAEHHAARVPERHRQRRRRTRSGTSCRRAARWSPSAGRPTSRSRGSGLPVRNVVAGLNSKEFFCPGSTLRVNIDNTHPLAYGMPSEGLVLFHYSPAFDVVATDFNDRNDDRRPLRGPERRAQRLAERREVHRREDGHGLDGPTARARSC